MSKDVSNFSEDSVRLITIGEDGQTESEGHLSRDKALVLMRKVFEDILSRDHVVLEMGDGVIKWHAFVPDGEDRRH